MSVWQILDAQAGSRLQLCSLTQRRREGWAFSSIYELPSHSRDPAGGVAAWKWVVGVPRDFSQALPSIPNCPTENPESSASFSLTTPHPRICIGIRHPARLVCPSTSCAFCLAPPIASSQLTIAKQPFRAPPIEAVRPHFSRSPAGTGPRPPAPTPLRPSLGFPSPWQPSTAVSAVRVRPRPNVGLTREPQPRGSHPGGGKSHHPLAPQSALR